MWGHQHVKLKASLGYMKTCLKLRTCSKGHRLGTAHDGDFVEVGGTRCEQCQGAEGPSPPLCISLTSGHEQVAQPKERVHTPYTAYLCLLTVCYRWKRNHISFGIHETGVVFLPVQ